MKKNFLTNLLGKLGNDKFRPRRLSITLIFAFSLIYVFQESKSLVSFSSHDEKMIPMKSANWNQNDAFPRWNKSGMPIAQLVDYTHGVLGETIEGHQKPTAVYIIDGNLTLWTSEKIRSQHTRLTKRIKPSERLALQSLKYLKRSILNNTTHPWTELEKSIKNGGFHFLVYHKDFNGCNRRNWRTNTTKHSIPIFTFSARLDCAFAFPWPTYESISLAKDSTDDWSTSMLANEQLFIEKKPKAIWRGSLTGTNNKDLNASARWQLCKLAQNFSSILDARLVHIPKWRTDANLTKVGGLAPLMDMESFQENIAIIDVDGNAWSSRFAALLCMDSVVLKVQPTMVDYFHFQLEPWTHYIPIRENLDDLVPNVEWVLANPIKTRRIVENAHRWCSKQMITKSLMEDLLSIWNSYIQNLDTASAGWSDIWRKEIPGFFQASNRMVPVEA